MSFSFSGTVTGGIQDISALLPLLGTEQCEEHVASSLVGGFIYAAATPLSIFGSLGLVRVGIKALVASVVFGFRGKKVMGARTLENVGLEPTGKVLSQIMWKNGRHIAEKELDDKLDELHITDTNRLPTVESVSTTWNWWMLVTSLVPLVFSLTPYVFIIKNSHDDKLSLRLFFPLARSIGSLVISIMIQILLQTRLLEIIKYRIVFLTVNDFIRNQQNNLPLNPNGISSEWWNARLSSEAALYRLRTFLAKPLKKQGDAQTSSVPPKSLLCRLRTCFKPTERRSNENSDPQLRSPHMPLHAPSHESSSRGNHRSFNFPMNLLPRRLRFWRTRNPDDAENSSPQLGSPPTSLHGSPHEPSRNSSSGGIQWSFNFPLKSFLRQLLSKPTRKQVNEKRIHKYSEGALKSLEDKLTRTMEEHFPAAAHFRRTLLVVQCSIVCGILLTVVGYIGCFSLVQSSSDSFGPLIWLLTELALSIIRMGLWGWNPAWDEEQTYLSFSVELAGRNPPSTCDRLYDDLEAEKTIQIPLTPAREFLRDIRAYVGWQEPVKILDSNVDLYYTMTRRRSDGNRVLYITISDHTLNADWTLVYPKQPTSKSERRAAQIGLDRVATLTELSTDMSVDGAFVEDLEAHCEAILRKLRLHTCVDALAQGLSEVQSEELRDRAQGLKTALMAGAREGFSVSEAHERLSMSLEWRLMDVLVVDQGQATPGLYAEALRQTGALRQALKQGQNREEVQRLAKQARKALLGEVPAVEPARANDEDAWQTSIELAEVVVLGLMLAQRQEQEIGQEQGTGQLTEAVSELAALVQDEADCEALDRTLTLVLVLNLWDSCLQMEEKAVVVVAAAAVAAAWARAAARAARVHLDPSWYAVAEEAWAGTRFIASAMATVLRRAQARTLVHSAQTAQARTPLKIRLTWALKPVEEVTEQAGKTTRTDQDRGNLRRPLTDDDLADMAWLKVGELELPKQQLCSKMDEWVEKGLPLVAVDTLPKWAEDDAVSRETIVEILRLVERYQLERMLVESSSEQEDILRWYAEKMVAAAALQGRRGRSREDAAKKANAERRVTDEAARVQERLKKLTEEARARIKRGGHSERGATLLESQWDTLQHHITKAWSHRGSNVWEGIKAHTFVYTPNTLCTLVQPQNRAQMKAWLEREQETMKEQLRKAQSDGYDEFLQASGNSGASTFLVRLFLTKTSKFLRMPSSLSEEYDVASIAHILGLNATVSCADFTACTVLQVIEIVRSSWKATGVTLIVSTEVLHDPKLERALRENKNIISLNSLDATLAIQANRMAAAHALKQGDTDGPLVYYECVEIADDNPYLVFKRPGKSRCTISFSVSDKYLAHKAKTGQLTLRLIHYHTSSDTKVDIHLNGDASDVLWDPELSHQVEIGVQDIVLPHDKLLPGLNTLTITLRGKYKRKREHTYRLRDVQLVWPPSISKKLKFLQLDSDVIGANVTDAIPNVLGESTVVSCRSRTLDQVLDIIAFLRGTRSVTLLQCRLDIGDLAEAEIACLQTALQAHQNILSISAENSIPEAIEQAMQANRTAAEDTLTWGDDDGPLVYYEDVSMDDDSSYLKFDKTGKSKCTVVFTALAQGAMQGAVTRQLILRLVHLRLDSDAEITICLNDTAEVPWDQENCPEGDFGVQDIVLPSDMLSPGVNRLTMTLTKCRHSWYRMKDVQLVWVEEVSLRAKFVRLHSEMVTEHNFTATVNGLGMNPFVSCIDCTNCALDEVIRIISTSLMVRSVTLIISPHLLKGPEADMTGLVLALMNNKHVSSLNHSHDPRDVPEVVQKVIEENRTVANSILQSGDNDQPLVFYECVEIDDHSSHLVFKQPSKSRCIVSFFVPAHGTVPVTLRLVHCRTTANAKVDILLNGATEIQWDQEDCPLEDFGVQNVVMAGNALRAGVNTLTITLRSDSDGAYQMKGLWPLSIGKDMKFLQLSSKVVWGNPIDAIPSILGASTVVSCWGRTLGQVVDIIDFLRGVKSLTLLSLTLDFDTLAEANIAHLQTALRDHQNVLSLNTTTKLARNLPEVLQDALQVNRTAAADALKCGEKDGPLVYYEDVDVEKNSYISFSNAGASRCTVLFSVPAKETVQGTVTGQLMLRLVHWRRRSYVAVDIRLNDTDEVPWDQEKCPQDDFGGQDVMLPSNMLSPGVNKLTITLTSWFDSWYRMKDVQLMWLGVGKESGGGQNLNREVERLSRRKRWGRKWRTGRQETTSQV